MSKNHEKQRWLQREAKQLAKDKGIKYTAALRELKKKYGIEDA